MIRRLRPAPSPDEIARMYPAPHDHRIYGDGHHLRVEQSKQIAAWMKGKYRIRSVTDLSCGNGEIAKSLDLGWQTQLGDFAPGHEFTGPIENTLDQVASADLFICCETLEHLDDPGYVLCRVREVAYYLLLGTPVGIVGDTDTNGEHLWQWDREGVEEMLKDAGWTPEVYASVDTRPFGEPYEYGLWGCV